MFDAGIAGGFHGFLYSGGKWVTLDDPLAANASTAANSINNAGQIVGYYNDGSGGTHGFIATVGQSHAHSDILFI
jgi:probable HAF family extracellular repeat protein